MDNIQLTIKSYMKNHKGQAIVMLILIMTVALAIGLSIVQKSLIDVSTSSKVEQSSRAFSAAEAGIEKALSENTLVPGSVNNLDNSSSSTFTPKLIPVNPTSGSQDALEILNLSKEDVGQIWLVDYNDPANPPSPKYRHPTLDIYWGDAALELTLVYYGLPAFGETTPDPTTAMYRSHKWYLDSTSRSNGFTQGTCSGLGYTINGATSTYKCKWTIGDTNSGYPNEHTLPTGPTTYPILLRVRLLYNTTPQPFAVQQGDSCGVPACILPAQKTVIDSVGTSGETQRKVNVTQTYKQVPNYFDYAIFSVGSIEK